MGIVYSTFNILGSTLDEENTTTTYPDGRMITSKKHNPWVAGAVAICATGILISYMDGGKGAISTSLGKVCKECSKKI